MIAEIKASTDGRKSKFSSVENDTHWFSKSGYLTEDNLWLNMICGAMGMHVCWTTEK